MLVRTLRNLAKDRRGALAAEMAVAILVLSSLLMSGVEVTRFVMANQKVERTSSTVADLVSQAEALTEADINDLFAVAGFVADPFDMAANGRVIVTSISKTSGNPPQVNWQRASGAGSGASTFGVEGGDATLPEGFIVRDGESIVVGETFFDFTPIFVGGIIGNSTLYNHAILRPRFGKLAKIS